MLRNGLQPGSGDGLTVTALARTAGVPATTIRFYERAGLVSSMPRVRGAYRRFPPDAPARVRFIRSAQALGLTLKDTRALLDLDSARECRDVAALLERRLGEVESRLSELTHFRDVLAAALAQCQRSGSSCTLLVSLGTDTGAKGTKPHEEEKRNRVRRRRGGNGDRIDRGGPAGRRQPR
jgi:MerR family mercuric resistance operon transcriptional regulator